jgi:hypothetical protein
MVGQPLESLSQATGRRRFKTVSALLPVNCRDDILPAYRATPVADVLAYHSLRTPHRSHTRAELLIGLCMDHRIVLRIPDNFACVLRAGGASLQRIEFKVSYAVAVGGVRAICLIAHDQCGKVDLRARYPRVMVAPLFYQVGEGLLYQITEGGGD